MKATFYTNNSEDNRMIKNLTKIFENDIFFKDDSSLISPSITISGQDLNTIVECNYVLIQPINYFYFIKNITAMGKNRYLLELDLDELSTFSSQLQNLPCIVKRQENKYNLYLADDRYKAYQKTSTVQKKFPNGFTSGQIIMTIIG